MIFAVAVAKSVVFFDTEQASAFAVAKDIHYLTITDLTWAPDGRSLTVASSDGYCTVVAFQVPTAVSEIQPIIAPTHSQSL